MTQVRVNITDTGWVTTFQDLGRGDSERLGVPTGGAADQHSAVVANLLVGNPRGATLIESLGGELALVPDAEVLLAVTGAPAEVTVDNVRVEGWTPIVVPAGHEVRIADVRLGSRVYVAMNGSIQTQTFLGSAAPDARMGFGQVLTRGSYATLDSEFHGFRHDFFDQSLFRLPVPVMRFADGAWTIDAIQSDQIGAIPGIRDLIAESTYAVTDRSNHVGLRLNGPVLHPESEDEIVSHGVPIGALEVPHADELIVLGRYRSLTAGYPIVGFVTRSAQSTIGQAGPGRELRFRWVDREDAVREHARRENELRTLERAAADAFNSLGLARRSVAAR